MPNFFPRLSGGSAVKYPLKRKRRLRSTVLTFGDFSEQRFAMGDPLDEFVLAFSRIHTDDKDLVRAFFTARRGAFDTDWSLTIEDPPGSTTTYNHLQFSPGQDFSAVEESTGLWSFSLQVRRTRRD